MIMEDLTPICVGVGYVKNVLATLFCFCHCLSFANQSLAFYTSLGGDRLRIVQETCRMEIRVSPSLIKSGTTKNRLNLKLVLV